jgi:hypothetical protein
MLNIKGVQDAEARAYTIAAQHRLWEVLVMPEGVSDLQRSEQKRAYYSGANAVLIIFFNHVSAPNVSNEDAMKRISALHRECAEFGKLIAEGKA